jgi:cyclopropane fatty-acyl-phospholipid synthase-like methyltransferase
MPNHNNHPHSSIPPEEYTREYYEHCCEGYEQFSSSHGEVLPLRLTIPLNLAEVEPGMHVVDLGCGRGEIVLHCALRGAWVWGLDYAIDALKLSKEIFEKVEGEDVCYRLSVQQCNAVDLPFANNSVDIVFMLDVVEHLSPKELDQSFDEVFRILQPGGRLIVHTMPSLWYYRFGYPIYRFFQNIRGQKLPADPRARWAFSHFHVNEQTPRSLKRSLISAGFTTQVWLMTTQSYEFEESKIVRSFMSLLTKVYPFKLIFCNDIFAIAKKT